MQEDTCLLISSCAYTTAESAIFNGFLGSTPTRAAAQDRFAAKFPRPFRSGQERAVPGKAYASFRSDRAKAASCAAIH